jgi:serpin B
MRFAALILSPLAAVWLASCGGKTTTGPEDNIDPALVYTPYVSSVQRDASPAVSDGDLARLVEGNNRFALKVFHKLLEENSDASVFSPFSVSSALAMTYAGAGGETKAEMADALEFTLGEEVLHPGFNKLATELAKRNLPGDASTNAQELLINNAIWPYIATPPAEPFLDTLSRHYGSGIYGLDYVNEPDLSRRAINEQVEEWTRGYIADLLPAAAITRDTRLVLTSAIYLHAPWDSTFSPSSTKPKPFHNLDGSVVEVPTMSGRVRYSSAELEGATLAALPFRDGQLYMAFLMPDDFSSYVANLDAETLLDGLAQMKFDSGVFRLPKFQLELEASMRGPLMEMGMVQAFAEADFSGMGLEGVQISDVKHKAFIDVNEAGTTAAAATAVIIGPPSIPPPGPQIDKPFVFLIYDNATKTILFLGHVANI